MDPTLHRRRDLAREDAVARIKESWAQGRIVGPDRDRRLAELERASSPADVAMIVHDLGSGELAVLDLGCTDAGSESVLDQDPRGATLPSVLLLIPVVISVALLASTVALLGLFIGLWGG